MFIYVHNILYINVHRGWNQLRCPSSKLLNQLWYMCTMECYSEIERNELLTHATIWMNLKGVMLSEKSRKHL